MRVPTANGVLSDDLTKLGIKIRDASSGELIELIIGRAYYDDIPRRSGAAICTLVKDRLSFTDALATVNDYHALIDEIDPQTHKPKRTEKGALVDRTPQIQASFNSAFSAYRAAGGSGDDMTAFRAFILSDPVRPGAAVSRRCAARDCGHPPPGDAPRYENAATNATLGISAAVGDSERFLDCPIRVRVAAVGHEASRYFAMRS